MPAKRPFLLYLRSRLNLWVGGAAAALLIIAALFVGRWLPFAALTVLAGYAAATVLLFFSRKGAGQIVEESEQDRQKKIREKIQASTVVRDRIAVLRVGDEGMRKSLEYFLLASGTYIEKCRELDLYSPRANARIEDVLGITQAFLGEMDQSSTEKRYGVKDGESFPEFTARCVEAVSAAATDLTRWTTEDLTGLSGRDSLAIIEELEGEK
jgi:hypothetical protein